MDSLLGFQQYLHIDSLRSIEPVYVYVLLFIFIFAKSGFLIGIFLPGGNSLVLTSGILASQNYVFLPVLFIVIITATIAGDIAGYLFGKKVGRKIFNKEKSLFFHKDYLIKAEKYYISYGSVTIILAKFVPVIRTFAPVVAGIGKMNIQKFVFFSAVGGLIWGTLVASIGYILGNVIPNIEQNLEIVVLIVLVATMIPSVIHLLIDRSHREQLRRLFKLD